MSSVSSSSNAGLGTFSFGGLASGLNTNQMLDQLMALERRPIALIQQQQSKLKLQKTTFQTVNSNLLKLQTSISALSDKASFDLFSASVSAASSSDSDILTASTSSDASPGTFSVEVLSLAKARSMSSSAFGTTALGYTGTIAINGKGVSVTSTMTLNDIKNAINDADVGVTAQVLSVSTTTNKLVVTSESTGADGFTLVDVGSGDLLQSLGFSGTATALKRYSGTYAESDRFSSSSSTIDVLLGKTTGVSGTVTIAGKSISVDFATDSLEAIKTKLTTGGGAISASVESETQDDGTTKYYLKASNASTSYTESNNILETLGILAANPKTSTATNRVVTGSVGNTTDGTTPIVASTLITAIYGSGGGSLVGRNITISGTKHDGTAATSTQFTIGAGSTVDDLLTAVETVLGVSASAGSVTADGKIQITDTTSGSSQMALALTVDNASNTYLNFGNMAVATEGSDASTSEVQTGQDANLKINSALVTRSGNTISDAISGVTLNLNRAKAGTPLTVTVSRDTGSIKSKIKSFVSDYNSALAYISNQFRYDQETQSAGPLTGDPTLLTIQSQARAQISASVTGLTSSYNSLAVIGISHDKEGVLKVDDAKLDSVLNSNFTDVRDIFIANGTPSVTDLEYVSVSDKTKAGTYTVNITTAARQATATTFAAIPTLTNAHTLTITDTSASISGTVSLAVGDNIDAVVNKINSELGSKKTQQRTTSGTGSLSASAKLSDATGSGGLGAADGEAVTISGRSHDGAQVSGSLTVTAGVTTVQDLLSEIEDTYNGTVTASIVGGKVVVTDAQSGASLSDITITSTGSAASNLGSFSLTTAGRSAVEITASKDGSNKLVLTHTAYGSAASKLSVTVSGFTSQEISYGSGSGTTASDTGVDVAGTIGGEAATGSGRILTGDSGNSNTEGLAIRVKSTAAGTIGTIKTTIGVGEVLERTLKTFTDSLSGLVASREDGLQNTIDDLDDRVEQMETRIELKRQRLSAQFTNLEKIVGSFNTLGAFLSAQLAKLPSP